MRRTCSGGQGNILEINIEVESGVDSNREGVVEMERRGLRRRVEGRKVDHRARGWRGRGMVDEEGGREGGRADHCVGG